MLKLLKLNEMAWRKSVDRQESQGEERKVLGESIDTTYRDRDTNIFSFVHALLDSSSSSSSGNHPKIWGTPNPLYYSRSEDSGRSNFNYSLTGLKGSKPQQLEPIIIRKAKNKPRKLWDQNTPSEDSSTHFGSLRSRFRITSSPIAPGRKERSEMTSSRRSSISLSRSSVPNSGGLGGGDGSKNGPRPHWHSKSLPMDPSSSPDPDPILKKDQWTQTTLEPPPTIDRATSPIIFPESSNMTSTSTKQNQQRWEELEKITGHIIIHKFITRNDEEFQKLLSLHIQGISAVSPKSGVPPEVNQLNSDLKGSNQSQSQVPPPGSRFNEYTESELNFEKYSGASLSKNIDQFSEALEILESAGQNLLGSSRGQGQGILAKGVSKEERVNPQKKCSEEDSIPCECFPSLHNVNKPVEECQSQGQRDLDLDPEPPNTYNIEPIAEEDYSNATLAEIEEQVIAEIKPEDHDLEVPVLQEKVEKVQNEVNPPEDEDPTITTSPFSLIQSYNDDDVGLKSVQDEGAHRSGQKIIEEKLGSLDLQVVHDDDDDAEDKTLVRNIATQTLDSSFSLRRRGRIKRVGLTSSLLMGDDDEDEEDPRTRTFEIPSLPSSSGGSSIDSIGRDPRLSHLLDVKLRGQRLDLRVRVSAGGASGSGPSELKHSSSCSRRVVKMRTPVPVPKGPGSNTNLSIDQLEAQPEQSPTSNLLE